MYEFIPISLSTIPQNSTQDLHPESSRYLLHRPETTHPRFIKLILIGRPLINFFTLIPSQVRHFVSHIRVCWLHKVMELLDLDFLIAVNNQAAYDHRIF